MNETPSYEGSCHCGAVRFTVRTDLRQLFDCNCSRCRRVASVMTAVPAADFELLQGEDRLQPYRFNHHAIEHLFCRDCGIQSFSRGSGPDGPTVVLNVGCLEGVPVVDRSGITHFDGASM
ncbi:MAG TPA: GFA family protein [Devosiaceae bacterium]|jgi:hypothetical protein|nr:GFA family protein [Devosiaceae bacterium]